MTTSSTDRPLPSISHAPQPQQMRRARAFWVVAYILLVAMMGSTLPTPLYVLYQARWHFPADVLTAIFAVYPLCVLASLLTFGKLSDLAGRRRMLLVALGLAFGAALCFFFAQGVGWLVAARGFTGLGVGICTGTATAALSELHPRANLRFAARVSAVTSIVGFGVGALLAGLLAQYAPWPTRLVFLFYIGLLLLALLGAAWLPETVQRPSAQTGRAALRGWHPQRPGVPREIRAPFALAALTVACGYAVAGLFAALAPSFVAALLHVQNRAVGGAAAAAIFGAAAVALVGLRHTTERRAIKYGLLLFLAGLVLVVVALAGQSLALFLVGTLCTGLGLGASFMGSLALINLVAPVLRRGEVLSAYY